MPVATDDDGVGDEAASAVIDEAPVADDGGSKVTIGEQVGAGQFVDVPAVGIDARPNRLSIGPDGILKILGGKRLSIGDIDIDTGSFKANLPGPRLSIGDNQKQLHLGDLSGVLNGPRLTIGQNGLLASANAAVQAHLAKAFRIKEAIRRGAGIFPITHNSGAFESNVDGLELSIGGDELLDIDLGSFGSNLGGAQLSIGELLDVDIGSLGGNVGGPQLSIGGDELLDIDVGSLEGNVGGHRVSVGGDELLDIDAGSVEGNLGGPRLSVGGDGILSLVSGAKAKAKHVANTKIEKKAALANLLLKAKAAKLRLIKAILAPLKAIALPIGNLISLPFQKIKQAFLVKAALKKALVDAKLEGLRATKRKLLPIRLNSGTLGLGLDFPTISLGDNGEVFNLNPNSLKGSAGNLGLTIDENGVIKFGDAVSDVSLGEGEVSVGDGEILLLNKGAFKQHVKGPKIQIGGDQLLLLKNPDVKTIQASSGISIGGKRFHLLDTGAVTDDNEIPQLGTSPRTGQKLLLF